MKTIQLFKKKSEKRESKETTEPHHNSILEDKNQTTTEEETARKIVEHTINILSEEERETFMERLNKVKNLSQNKQTKEFFNIYIDVQKRIIEQPTFHKNKITISNLKEEIRNRYPIRNLKGKYQLLFLKQDLV